MKSRSSPFSLTGEWSGEFSYPQHLGPVTPFVARIEEADGQVTGTSLEPDTIDGGTINAMLNGVRQGLTIDFVKTYTDLSEHYDTPVDYVGRISRDGNVISGVWSRLDMDGRFEMRRELKVADEVAVHAHIQIPEPVATS